MADRIQLRRDTAANWTQYNPILLEGEPGIEIDTDQWKMGDGVHTWSQLAYRGGECVQQKGSSTTVAMSQKAVTVELDALDYNKMDKVIGDNLINPAKITNSRYITSGGTVGNGDSAFSVSEKIPVNGQDIICNGIAASYARAWVVYDANGNYLRHAAEGVTQYTYQDGDAYIIFGFLNTSAPVKYANYGTTLITKPYTQNAPLDSINTRVTTLEGKEETIENKVETLENEVETLENDKVTIIPCGINLINFNNVTIGGYIGASGGIGNASGSEHVKYGVSDYILVNGQNISSNGVHAAHARAWVVYNANKEYIRHADQDITKYTYVSGDVYVRFGFFNGNGLIDRDCMANYGDTLLPYSRYVDYKPVYDLGKEVDFIDRKLISSKENLINKSDIEVGKLFNWAGSISAGYPDAYGITDYIKVNASDIIANSWGDPGNWAHGTVYDVDKKIIRIIYAQQYTYQEGDAYVRFTLFSGDQSVSILDTTPRAYYGTTFSVYKPYSGKDRLDIIENDINNIDTELQDKLDKIPGENLIDPNNLLLSHYIMSNGYTDTGAPDYAVSAKISVFKDGIGQNISSNALKRSYAGTYVVYDADNNILRTVLGADVSNKYEYQEGDAYVRFGFQASGTPTIEDWADLCKANYGDTLTTEKYTSYQPLLDLEERVAALEQGGGGVVDITISTPNALYSVYNSMLTSRQTIGRLYMSHLLNSSEYRNQGLYFDNMLRNIPIIPSAVATKSETTKTINITPKGTQYKNKSFTTKMRMVNAVVSKDITPKILIIGDSVTDAYGGTSNRKTNWLPGQYGAFAKMYFEMDKIDGGDNAAEYNAIFLGGAFNRSYDFNIHYGGVTRAVRSKSQGQGGAQLNELYSATWGGGSENPFYDTVNETFSIADYITKYRTMDDLGVRLVSNSADPHGETVTGSDGNSYTIGTKITSQSLLSSIDVCTPTHIVINLNHNTSIENFQTYFPQVISKIKSELPDAVIICMAIDETGTYFPCDYPNYESSMLNYGGLHSSNLAKCNWFKDNALDEANSVYLLDATYYCQPTAESQPTIEVDCAEYVNRDRADKTTIFHIENKGVSGSHWHPNNLCHEAWGYQLYAMIKYLIS